MTPPSPQSLNHTLARGAIDEEEEDVEEEKEKEEEVEEGEEEGEEVEEDCHAHMQQQLKAQVNHRTHVRKAREKQGEDVGVWRQRQSACAREGVEKASGNPQTMCAGEEMEPTEPTDPTEPAASCQLS